MATFTVTTEYLEHALGTKFYETVLLRDNSWDRAILIKRYGRINTSGQKIVERGSVAQMKRACSTILSQKMKRDYSNSMRLAGVGLHKRRNMTVAGDELATIAADHYGRGSPEYAAIVDFVGGVAAASAVSVMLDEPEVAVERGEAWGSF